MYTTLILYECRYCRKSLKKDELLENSRNMFWLQRVFSLFVQRISDANVAL